MNRDDFVKLCEDLEWDIEEIGKRIKGGDWESGLREIAARRDSNAAARFIIACVDVNEVEGIGAKAREAIGDNEDYLFRVAEDLLYYIHQDFFGEETSVQAGWVKEAAVVGGYQWSSTILNTICDGEDREAEYGERLEKFGHALLNGGARVDVPRGGCKPARLLMLRSSDDMIEAWGLMQRILDMGSPEDLNPIRRVEDEIAVSPLRDNIRAYMERKELGDESSMGKRGLKRKI